MKKPEIILDPLQSEPIELASASHDISERVEEIGGRRRQETDTCDTEKNGFWAGRPGKGHGMLRPYEEP